MRGLCILAVGSFLALATLAFAQTDNSRDPVRLPSAPTADVARPSATTTPVALEEVIKKQFGTGFVLASDCPTPFLVTDLDGDGIEDAVIVARSKKVPHEDLQLGYKLIDPYDEYFGFGDTKITAQFALQDPDRAKYLLIIHGSGSESWRAATPKAKFVLINLPFDRLGLERVPISKKKVVTAISAEETAMMSSMVFWNGKKYKWMPNGIIE